MDLATPTVGPRALVRHSPRNRDLAAIPPQLNRSQQVTASNATNWPTTRSAPSSARRAGNRASSTSCRTRALGTAATRVPTSSTGVAHSPRCLPALVLWNGGSSSHSHVYFHSVAGCVRVGFVKPTCTRSMVGLRRNTSSASGVQALSHSPCALSRQVQCHARLHGALALHEVDGEPPSSSPRAMASPCD